MQCMAAAAPFASSSDKSNQGTTVRDGAEGFLGVAPEEVQGVGRKSPLCALLRLTYGPIVYFGGLISFRIPAPIYFATGCFV